MINILRQLCKDIPPIVGAIVFITLLIIGSFLFSYILVIGAFVVLILLLIVFTQLKIAQWKQQKKTKSPPGRIIEYDDSF